MHIVDVCSLQQIEPGARRAVRAAGADIALFNIDGALHALENSCLHAGAALRLDEAAGAADADFYRAKIGTARFFADHILTQAAGYRCAVVDGSAGVLALSDEQF